MKATATVRIPPIVCYFCEIEGHSRRNHQDCTGTSPVSAVSKNNGNTAVVCSSCGMEGQFRRAYRDCPMNSGIVGTFIEPPVIAIAAPNSVTCPHCGREGHLRRSHSNCAINFTAQNRVSYLNIARDPALPELQGNNVGSMDVICSSCRAHMWMSERKSNTSMATPVFQTYCATGQAILKQLAALPEQIVNLLKNNNAESKQFKENIRSYNSALSFASMNADLDRRYANHQHGVYAFRIHDGVYYLISSALIPEKNNAVQQPRFAQIYTFDS